LLAVPLNSVKVGGADGDNACCGQLSSDCLSRSCFVMLNWCGWLPGTTGVARCIHGTPLRVVVGNGVQALQQLEAAQIVASDARQRGSD